MEYFVFGIIFGYLLFPLSERVGSIVAKHWDSMAISLQSAKKCTGPCDQGRSDCTCKT